MRNPTRVKWNVNRKPPEKIFPKLELSGKAVEMIFEKIMEIEGRTGSYCGMQRAIHSLLMELYQLKKENKVR